MPDPKKAKRSANRLTVRNSVVTLRLNGEEFDVHLDDRTGLHKLCGYCESAGEDQLSEQLTAIIEEIIRPEPQTLEAWRAELAQISVESEQLITQILTGGISLEDSRSATALKAYRNNKLEQQIKRRRF